MNIITQIKLDRDGAVPIYRQLGEGLFALIESGKLGASAKLPPIRTLAAALGINTITVVNAYKLLEKKRAVYSITGSGTYVSSVPANPARIPEFSYNFIERHDIITDEAINFAKSSASPDLFPVKEFQVFLNDVLERDKGGAFSYHDISGYLPLREAICGYIGRYGVRTNPGHVQIINGAQQGIDLISKALLSQGDTLLVEKPTYYGALGAFFSRGAEVIEVKLRNDGMDMDALESALRLYKPEFIYVMPYFQTPTGISYSLEKKRRLLTLAEKYGTYIIEEDNQNEFSYGSQKIIPLKALDYKNRVIYIKSFSKIMMPGLRLGFMVIPKAIHQKIRDIKYATDISTSGLTQRAFDLFLRSHLWDERIAYMKNIFSARYKALTEAVRTLLPPWVRYGLPGGGCSIWLRFPGVDTGKLCSDLLQRSVLATPGGVYSQCGDADEYLRLSFASANESEIKTGIRILADLL